MNVADLRALLEDFEDDTEVRFASQPSWPFEYSIDDVIEPEIPTFTNWLRQEWGDDQPLILIFKGLTDNERTALRQQYAEAQDTEPIVYLVEGTQIGYLPGSVKDAIGW